MIQTVTRWKTVATGAHAGLVAGVAMTSVMLALAWFGVATPITMIGDRISVFIPADTFLALMGRVGGYNHMKQLGAGSVIAGQLVLAVAGGVAYASRRRTGLRSDRFFTSIAFILLPELVAAVALWPVLGTHYAGRPIVPATVATLLGLALAFVVFERTLVTAFDYLTQSKPHDLASEFTPSIKRRGLLLSGFGLLVSGGGVALARKLYAIATFAYDGTQYKGTVVRPITPNDQFYCVTKNIVDPRVDARVWRLEITGLVEATQSHDLARLKSFPAVTQETTLMCISNGLDAGLMSNAVWRGVPMPSLIDPARAMRGATKVRLHGVDNYTDTIPFEKAQDPNTMVAYEMNGEALPDRHGFPARVVVPGYYGEKHVKWVTRIELTDDRSIGFYEKQGWGPDFIVPTRSRIDAPNHESWHPLSAIGDGIVNRGVAFGGDRGISRVELTFDDGTTWQDANLDYPGTKLTWALWSYAWKPSAAGDYIVSVRATDGEGRLQELDRDRPFKSGVTGFHTIIVHVF